MAMGARWGMAMLDLPLVGFGGDGGMLGVLVHALAQSPDGPLGPLWEMAIAAVLGAARSPAVWGAIALVAAWLGGVLGLAEWLYRHRGADAEVGRKIVHIGAGNVVLLAWGFQIPAWLGVAAAIVAAAVALLSYRIALLPSVNSVNRHSWGTFFYAVSVGVAIAVGWGLDRPYLAAVGICVMAWGDGLAALVGQNFGRHRYEIWGNRKSIEGTATMWLASFGVTALILTIACGPAWTVVAIAAGVATGATILETVAILGIDNLTVPLGSAAIAYGLVQWWQG